MPVEQTPLWEIGARELVEACTQGTPGWAGMTAREKRSAATYNLEKMVALRAEVEAKIRESVDVMRENSSGSRYWSDAMPWTEIGKILGVSKQAAQARYGKRQ